MPGGSTCVYIRRLAETWTALPRRRSCTSCRRPHGSRMLAAPAGTARFPLVAEGRRAERCAALRRSPLPLGVQASRAGSSAAANAAQCRRHAGSRLLPRQNQLACTSSCQQPLRWWAVASGDVSVARGKWLLQSQRAAQRVLCQRHLKQVQQQQDDQTMVCLTTSRDREAGKRRLRRGEHMYRQILRKAVWGWWKKSSSCRGTVDVHGVSKCTTVVPALSETGGLSEVLGLSAASKIEGVVL
jgi:hypothetical protein